MSDRHGSPTWMLVLEHQKKVLKVMQDIYMEVNGREPCSGTKTEQLS